MLKRSGEPEERVARKPGKKKKTDSNQHIEGLLEKEIYWEEKVRSFIKSYLRNYEWRCVEAVEERKENIYSKASAVS